MAGNPPLTPIAYSLSIKAAGYAFVERQNVVVPPGKDAPNVHFTLGDKSSAIQGKVTADDGKTPIPNAHVQLMRVLTVGGSAGGPQPAMRTAADGTFTFNDVAPGRYQIYTSAPNFIATENKHVAEVSVMTGVPAQGVHLMLSPAASVEGVIYESDGVGRDASATPLRNEFVEVRAQMVTDFGRSSRSVSLNVQDGKYLMSHLEPGVYEIVVFVEKRGIAQMRTVKVNKGEKVKEFNLRLGEEPLLMLTVRSATDKSPVTDAQIFMRTSDASSWWLLAKGDASGTLRVGGLKPQRYFFWATSPTRGNHDYPRQNDEGTVVNVTRARSQYQADVLLRSPASVVGRVVDEQKKPVVGAQIQISPSAGGVVQAAVTDADGRFRVAPLRGDTYRLTTHKEGYETYADNVFIADGVENKVKDVTIAFLGFGAIKGRVVSVQGTMRIPARAAQVSWRRLRSDRVMRTSYQPSQGGTVLTDEGGNFQMVNIPAGLYDVIVAPSNGPVIVREQVFVKRGETVTVGDVVIPPTGTLAGKIRTPDGSPLPYSTEVIVGPRGMSGGLVSVMVSAGSRNPSVTDQYAARVNNDGTFRVTGILPGTYEVIARGPGLLAPAPQVIEIKANQTVNLNFATPRSGKIVGRVTNLATSQPVSGAYVYLYDPASNETMTATTDARGNYAIERVRPGTTRIVCRTRGYALATRFDVVVEEGETAIVDFLLTPGGSVSGRVKGPVVRQAHNSSLQVAVNSNLSLSSYVRSDGSYRIEHVPPGVYSIDLFIGNSGVLSVSGVVIEEGKETTGIDFESPER
jgi:hypothetical protein